MEKDKDDILVLETDKENQRNSKRKPATVISVKTGSGGGFLQIRYWRGDSTAKKRFQRESSIQIVKKKREDGEWKDSNDLHLTVSQAISVAPVLSQLGLRGKENDLEHQA